MMKQKVKKIVMPALLATMMLGANGASLAETYSYDEQGRLTKVVYADNSMISYSYDKRGNRTQAVTGVFSGSSKGGGGGGGSLGWGMIGLALILTRRKLSLPGR